MMLFLILWFCIGTLLYIHHVITVPWKFFVTPPTWKSILWFPLMLIIHIALFIFLIFAYWMDRRAIKSSYPE